MPISARNSAFSSSANSAISLSNAAHTATTGAFSLAASSRNMSRCGLFSKPSSATLPTYIAGLAVNKNKGLSRARLSASKPSERTGLPSFRCGSSFSHSATNFCASLSPDLAFLPSRSIAFSTLAKSAKASSVPMVSMSAIGSTLPATCTMLSSSKQRTTFTMASVSRILARNWLPKPSPLLAPATKPAISTNSTIAGCIRCGLTIFASSAMRGSGTSTMPTLGSMVQNG